MKTLILWAIAFVSLTVSAQTIDQRLVDAIQTGDMAAVKTLVESGVDLNLTEDRGFNAFTFAIRGSNPEMVFYLKEKGSKILPGQNLPLICNSFVYTENNEVFKAALQACVDPLENNDGVNIFRALEGDAGRNPTYGRELC